ncbi:Uncharacterized protein DAT39_005072 [Clarias magur]|uniref:Uncharacterized protein n=1 Tax=Clarias magur TaxID=1594786 RepID=A0A8J4X5X1_CLAMG|nr:Uncharacterized protein DAT39_005072 [Clarias magur]
MAPNKAKLQSACLSVDDRWEEQYTVFTLRSECQTNRRHRYPSSDKRDDNPVGLIHRLVWRTRFQTDRAETEWMTTGLLVCTKRRSLSNYKISESHSLHNAPSSCFEFEHGLGRLGQQRSNTIQKHAVSGSPADPSSSLPLVTSLSKSKGSVRTLMITASMRQERHLWKLSQPQEIIARSSPADSGSMEIVLLAQ